MECFGFSLDSKISKEVEARHKKTVMSDWNGERNVRGWLARTAVRHWVSRTQGKQNQRPHLDSKMFGTIWNLTLYWLKDWMIKIWLRLLCMSRLWLYESCSFQYKTQWGHWPTSPTCPCGVWESQEVPLFNALLFEDDAYLILRLMWIEYGNWFTMIIRHAAGGSKQHKRYKRQSLKVDAWTAKEFKKTTFWGDLLSHLFWRPVSSDSSRMEQVKLT